MPISFDDLRNANIARLPQFKNAKGEPAHSQPDGSDWSDSDWIMAVTGELGELANLRKKVLRGDLSMDEARPMLADELADVATYLDILALRMGIDLGEAVVSKFNRVSERVGCDVKLPVRNVGMLGLFGQRGDSDGALYVIWAGSLSEAAESLSAAPVVPGPPDFFNTKMTQVTERVYGRSLKTVYLNEPPPEHLRFVGNLTEDGRVPQ